MYEYGRAFVRHKVGKATMSMPRRIQTMLTNDSKNQTGQSNTSYPKDVEMLNCSIR